MMIRFNQKGVSLLELLAAITISTIIIGVISAVLYQTNTGFSTITARESVQETARIITEHIVNKTRERAYTGIFQENSTNGVVLNLTQNVPTSPSYRYEFNQASQEFHIITTLNGVASQFTVATNVREVNFALYDRNFPNAQLAANSSTTASKIRIRLNFANTQLPYETTIFVPTWGTGP
jgi:Tfp pilus assembly protein PilW